jgi:hypothetical protein
LHHDKCAIQQVRAFLLNGRIMMGRTTIHSPGSYSSLCCPDDEKSCFRCCPPIRPPHYDHLDYKTFLARELAENTRAFKHCRPTKKNITGFTCWGLGFLDSRFSKIGCLLHPARNHQNDLRDLTGYGDKCRRELCHEARQFQKLSPELATRLLILAKDLDSFAFSSPQKNPLFKLLHWSPRIIRNVFQKTPDLDREAYISQWSFLTEDLNAGRDEWLITLFMESLALEHMGADRFLQEYKRFLLKLERKLGPVIMPPLENRPYIHQLDLTTAEKGFLKSCLGWNRLELGRAQELLDTARRFAHSFLSAFIFR